MIRNSLPRLRVKVIVPPLKCQGIKTKLVPFIASNIVWKGEGRWIEPFLGSGVVLFSIQPQRALVSDINPHLVNFYLDIQKGNLIPANIRQFLVDNGNILRKNGIDHYYAVRERFNNSPNSLDFLFLSRAGFNGLMRFNQKGKFNVPFCHKPDRFSRAYITKIVNQVKSVQQLMQDKDWELVNLPWRECLREVRDKDFIYLDPPYIGRNTDYYNQWTEDDAVQLAKTIQSLNCGFAMSMWLENKYRRNLHLEKYWGGAVVRTMNHFYHIGSTEDLRNEMIEALIIKPGYEDSQVVGESASVRVNKSSSKVSMNKLELYT